MTRGAHRRPAGAAVGLVLAVALLAAAAARADIITLTNGRTIRGKIVSETPGRVVIDIPGGRLTIAAAQIESIERESESKYRTWQAKALFDLGRSKDAVAQLRKALAATRSAEARQALAAGLLRRADELEDAGSLSEAAKAYREVLSLDAASRPAAEAIDRINDRIKNLRSDIREARELITAGNTAAAYVLLGGVLEDCPEMRAELARPYARTLVGFGDAAYVKKDFARAAARYAGALEYDPLLAREIGPRLVNSRLHGVAEKINLGLFEQAEAELENLAEFSPTNAEIKYVTGRCAEIRGRFGEAAIAYAGGLGVSLAGTQGKADAQRLRAQLEKKLEMRGELERQERREWSRSEPGDWMVLNSPRFAVHHHNAAVGETVASTAEFHYGRIIRELALGDVSLDGRLRIYIHRSSEEYVKATGQPEWSAGVSHMDFRGRRLDDQYIASYQASPRLLKSIIPHELTHVLFSKAIGYGRDFPLALHEGVAVAMEPEFKQRHYRSVVWNHLRTETLIPLRELLAMKTYPAEPDVFYAQSTRLVEMLLARAGPKAFLEFCRAVKDGGVERALRDVYRIDGYDELERLYREFIRPKAISPAGARRAG